jgi:quercetin dioxygenase-like cupin family protein
MASSREGRTLKPVMIAVMVVMLGTVSLLDAQQSSPIKRTPLQKFDVPGTNYETVIGIAEIGPNVNVGRHTHPGPESGYLLEGDFILLVEGQPPLSLKAGDSYKVPSGAIHDARAGDKGAKVIATYVVEKGKPLASPAN